MSVSIERIKNHIMNLMNATKPQIIGFRFTTDDYLRIIYHSMWIMLMGLSCWSANALMSLLSSYVRETLSLFGPYIFSPVRILT